MHACCSQLDLLEWSGKRRLGSNSMLSYLLKGNKTRLILGKVLVACTFSLHEKYDARDDILSLDVMVADFARPFRSIMRKAHVYGAATLAAVGVAGTGTLLFFSISSRTTTDTLGLGRRRRKLELLKLHVLRLLELLGYCTDVFDRHHSVDVAQLLESLR